MLKINYNRDHRSNSIILEWTNGNLDKSIGIIDCGLTRYGNNPVIEYLQNNSFQEISFILLSHPHYDRYSGILKLLDYCRNNAIIIKQFMHTLNIPNDYIQKINEFNEVLTSPEISKHKKNELRRMFVVINHLYDDENSIVKQAGVVLEGSQIMLSDKLTLSILSPSNNEVQKYYKQLHTKGIAKPNLLSSISVIETDEWQVLFTSDATEETFIRLLERNDLSIFRKRTILAEVPNQGSKFSFLKDFWEKLKTSDSTIFLAVSSEKYGLPHKEVTDYFTAKCKALNNSSKEKITNNLFLDVLSRNDDFESFKIQLEISENGEFIVYS